MSALSRQRARRALLILATATVTSLALAGGAHAGAGASLPAEGSGASDAPSVKATFSCSSVTFSFSGFPNAPNNTVKERVLVNRVTVFAGTFTFDGPSGSNTVSLTLPPGHSRVIAAVRWNTNGAKGERDRPAFRGVTCPPHVFVGYADSKHHGPGGHPTPWEGDAGVTFAGCGFGGIDSCPTSGGADVYDAGAIRIDAPSGEALKVTGASVQIGPCSYAPWPRLNVTIPAGGMLILTQTGKQQCTATGGAEQDNFDTSESFLKSPQYQEFKTTGRCSNDGYIPAITVTVNRKTTTVNDTAQVLNGGGVDPDICGKTNESHEWVQIQ